MPRTVRFRPLLLVGLGLSLSTCKKDRDPTPLERLPPATTEGKNTWGCLVNGEAWTETGPSNMRADWTVPDGMSIGLFFSTNKSVHLGFPDSTQRYQLAPGAFRLTPPPGNYASIWIGSKLYAPQMLRSGHVTLTRLDRSAGIVAGTFAFVIAASPGDTLRVTDGRFDIGNMDR